MPGTRKKTEFETEWFSIESEHFDDLAQLGGKPIYRINVLPSSSVVALTRTGKLILVRQYRPVLNEWSLEFPAGSISPGESAEVAARRELWEETGYHCDRLSFVGAGGAMVDRVNSQVNIFFGENAYLSGGSPVAEPGVEVVLMTLGEFKDLILGGQFRNIPALGMVLWIYWKIKPELFIGL